MRRQRPRGSTTRDDVVAAALAVADRDGVGAMTIRAVAKAVGAPPMSLYSHFANKDELLGFMYAAVAKRLYVDHGCATWQEELIASCHQVSRVLLEHPNWIALFSQPVPASAVPLRERLLRMMTEAGMPPEVALAGVSNGIVMSIGLVLVQLNILNGDGTSAIARRFELIREWIEREPASEHAVTHRAFKNVHPFDFNQSHAFVIRTYVQGLEASFPATARAVRDPGTGDALRALESKRAASAADAVDRLRR
jgi:AcrR family transcriptional regulator